MAVVDPPRNGLRTELFAKYVKHYNLHPPMKYGGSKNEGNSTVIFLHVIKMKEIISECELYYRSECGFGSEKISLHTEDSLCVL